jgi:hypothetical protein
MARRAGLELPSVSQSVESQPGTDRWIRIRANPILGRMEALADASMRRKCLMLLEFAASLQATDGLISKRFGV